MASALESVETECSSYLPHPERVAAACDVLRQAMGADAPAPAGAPSWVTRLLPLPARRTGAVVAPVCALLEEIAAVAADPWPPLAALLAAQDGAIEVRALDALVAAVEANRLPVTPAMIDALAERVDEEGSPLAGASALAAIGSLLQRLTGLASGAATSDPRTGLLLHGSTLRTRRLAARVLDLDVMPPDAGLVARMLGPEACAVLASYLAYTRATHQDLVDLLPITFTPDALESFRRAERICGEPLLREVVAALGWPRLNLGLESRPVVGLSLGGSFPFLLAPAEARLFDEVPDAQRVFSRVVILATGGRVTDQGDAVGATDAIARFRAYNVVHAEVLTEILDVAPLTRARLQTVVEKMARLVADFTALFGQAPELSTREEAAALGRVHADLVRRIGEALAHTDADPLPMEVCRLVQPFEDPAAPGAIRTMHGLKRYLHQRGLKLAFSLIGSGPKTTRTIDLAIAAPGREVEVGRHIEFIDLEAPADGAQTAPAFPSAVRLAADAFARQMLHGQRIPSHLRVFCYGNEVHYFARFRNHPAFIRIDFSPPLRGGMIDLQYVGVSNYDLDVHPCVSLDSIRHFFERLDFVVSVDQTSIHARYDKERAVTLDQLHHRAALLFHLLPYLMDLDWTIGSLPLPDDVKRTVTSAWADFFTRWGVLPYHQFLTRDRSAVLTGVDAGPEGPREARWTGDGPYRDRFTVQPSDAVLEAVRVRIARLGIETPSQLQADDLRGQLALDAKVLGTLRAAIARGEISDTPGGLQRAPATCFERIHEVDRLAATLESEPAEIARGAYLAQAIPLIERHARFATTGSVNGCAVQRVRLSLGPTTLTVCVLRDTMGMARLALATDDEGFWRRRAGDTAPWCETATSDPARVLERLRRANILGASLEAIAADPARLAEALHHTVRASRLAASARSRAGERAATGVGASPGRAAGPARLGAQQRQPHELRDAVFIAATLEPTDAPCLFHAAAVAATGGGILSHLGLLAVESGKPAVILDATWVSRPNGERVLSFMTTAYDEREHHRHGYRLVERHHVREVEDAVHDGDIVVVDADRGTLTALGNDALTLALYESLRQHAAACRRLEHAAPDDVLTERGHHLRTRHQVEKVLARLRAPALVRFAVEEILLNPAWADTTRAARDGVQLLRLIAEDGANAEVVRDTVQLVAARMAGRVRESREQATLLIPSSVTCHDVLALRLHVRRSHDLLQSISARLEGGGFNTAIVGAHDHADVDALAVARLGELRDDEERCLADPTRDGGRRSRLQELTRADRCLCAPEPARTALAAHLRDCESADRLVADGYARRAVIRPGDGGLELAPLVGAKAANLAEAARILGDDFVPAWFAVTGTALRAVLDSPAASLGIDLAQATRPERPGVTFRDCIAGIANDAAASFDARAADIGALWRRVRLPDALAQEVAAAYRDLGASSYVAIRSSGFDEDTEGATRAGQFDTFLFVRGEASVLEHLLRAWSGFWTERALHDRAERGDTRTPSGGVAVQRMVLARVSGVMQTVNVAARRPRELVINAGLGLGEGIVSGTVAADCIVVSKEHGPEATLRFRYATADKRQRVVFDERFGQGTVRVDTLAHQRLRPALEYPELRALVDLGLGLERAYGHPLDIEFAFEDADLRVLQVRPVPTAMAVWRETMEKYPLRGAPRAEEWLP